MGENTMEQEFVVGDLVEVLVDDFCRGTGVKKGTLLPVVEQLTAESDAGFWITLNGVKVSRINLENQKFRFRLVIPAPRVNVKTSILNTESNGVYRPVLEERKNDKVLVELVDFGFPNALWELAKLMTWAQTAKGYKPHDWKNLPNAEVAFAAAASRHRQKHNKGEIHDDESGLLHKVHEAFNVLGELELMLTGKIVK